MLLNHIYFIGGSPCCGKSTIAERISEAYGFQYYEPDKHLMQFIAKGGADGDEWLKYISMMSMDDSWLREPEVLNAEELITYEKLLPYFVAGLEQLSKNTPIITEGAAYLPDLIYKLGVDKSRYICMVPTKEFQIKYFSKREWVGDYLSPCSDKEKAFSNWMGRDVLFALAALKQARDKGYETLIVDGSKSIEENYRFVIEVFKTR
jgi:hypothetical protein